MNRVATAAKHNSVGDEQTQPPFAEQVKEAVFGAFYSMRQRDSKARVTLASHTWNVGLLVIDMVQVRFGFRCVPRACS